MDDQDPYAPILVDCRYQYDSQYIEDVKDVFRDWYKVWEANGWYNQGILIDTAGFQDDAGTVHRTILAANQASFDYYVDFSVLVNNTGVEGIDGFSLRNKTDALFDNIRQQCNIYNADSRPNYNKMFP